MGLIGDIAGIFTSGRAAHSVSDANIAAEHGVLGAAQGATSGISDAVGAGASGINAAGTGVTDAANSANSNLQSHINSINSSTNPYMQAGQQAITSLSDYATKAPQFSFNPSNLQNDPGYQFQLQQGQDAITNRSSAMGLNASGNTLKDLTSFGQGLAGTYYNDAFNRAKSTFDTNQNATLSNLSTLASAGLQGNQQMISGTNPLALQQSGNTMGAAGANANLQQYLASLRLQGATSAGGLSLTGAKEAGDFAVGAGQAHASGIMNQGAAVTSGIGDLSSLVFGGGSMGPAASILFGGQA